MVRASDIQVPDALLSHIERLFGTMLVYPVLNHIFYGFVWLGHRCRALDRGGNFAFSDFLRTSSGSISSIQDRIVSVTVLCSTVPGWIRPCGSMMFKASESVWYLSLVNLALTISPSPYSSLKDPSRLFFAFQRIQLIHIAYQKSKPPPEVADNC
ncbi:MAG: hypothetical protein PVF97_10915, partial [Desulfobacterales bacterium]